MNAITNVKELYIEFIRDIYNAEILLLPELQRFHQKTNTPSLKKALKEHLNHTRSHITLLEDLQENIHANMFNTHCRTMKYMILESRDLVDRCRTDELAERAIAASLFRITHCMITVYQMLISLSAELEFSKHTEMLGRNLEEEINFEQQINANGLYSLFGEFNINKRLL